MRLAVEWIRTNIKAFRGDTSHITLLGQSHGAYLISNYAYAFPDDPVANSFIEQHSDSAFSPEAQNATVRTAVWKNASAAVVCNQTSDASILEGMRAQNVSTILSAWASVAPSSALSLRIGPEIDDELVYAIYTEKTLAGEIAQKVSTPCDL